MKNFNYSVHHELFKEEIVQDLKGNHRRCTVMIWSMIIHFTHHTGKFQFWQKQWCQDWGFHQRDARQAIKTLLDNKKIKVIVPYCRKTSQGAVYTTDTGSVHIARNLYPKETKPVSTVDKVNNNKKIIKGQSHSFLENVPANLAHLAEAAEQQLKAGIPEEIVRQSLEKQIYKV